MTGIVLEVADLGQDAQRTPGDLLALGGQRDPAAAALDQRRIQPGLELLNLDRERWLTDRALLGRASEMAMPGEGREIAELAQGGHRMI